MTKVNKDWKTKYSSLILTAADAVQHLKPGNRVFIGSGCAQPQQLVDAMMDRGDDLADMEIIHILTSGTAPYADPKWNKKFRVNSFFIGENVRETIQNGEGDYTPVFLSDIPKLFSSGQLTLDAALIQVSPPDEHGMCSMGVSIDIVKSAAENASLVIAEVNPNMPRTRGHSSLNIYDFDYVVPVDNPIIEYSFESDLEEIQTIAEYVSALVSDGSTIEVGIGAVPQAVMQHLGHKKDLGIHTEMLTDSIIPLMESGVINGQRKVQDRGKVVASFCMGTRKLYDYIDGNDAFAFFPTEYVNDPSVISRHNDMIAINVALEIDISGQVCSDSIGTKFYSGFGGQVDFNRGAAQSSGGKAIIALPSTAKDGEVSRIVPHLQAGAGVVTTRGDVHYVVTEHGVAYLHGKSVQERALALISVAHPKFRAELMKKAIESKYISGELADKEGKIVVGPKELKTTFLLNDGTQINFRPIHPTDEPAMRDLFYALSQETIYYRFMSNVKHIPRKQIQDFVYIDHRNEVAIVATVPAPHGDELIAIGRYYLDSKTNTAEVAFVVQDDWQNKGIGTALLKHLITIARRNGISGFTAEVLRDNKQMQAVFNKCNCKVTSKLNEGVYSYELDFVST